MTTDLAIGLSTADAAALAAVADEVAEAERVSRAADAQRVRALARAHDVAEGIARETAAGSKAQDMAYRTVASEIAVPLLLNDRSLQHQMGDAAVLVADYPQTVESWEAGRISRGHVLVIDRAGAHLPSEQRRLLDMVAVRVAERETAGRAKAVVEMLAEKLHPRSLTERHIDARTERRVCVAPVGDGMSRITADIPAVLGEGIDDRLTRQAVALLDAREAAKGRLRDARAAGVAEGDLDGHDVAVASDIRTREQVRADILVDLLLAGQPSIDPTAGPDGHGELGAIRARVQVVIPATTLREADEHPVDLVGASPVDAATARELAGNCTGFDRLLTHPVTGQILATDSYTPTADLRRRLRARDRHCRFPGCRVPAIRCEHDHTIDHALGGKTTLGNLAGLCQRHHTMKQFTPWRVKQLGDGILEWTSPTGRTYTDDPPPPTVCFTPDDGSPPF